MKSNSQQNNNSREPDADIFKPDRRESAVDRVLNVVKEALLTEKLKPGDKLPSEMDLSRKLAISRGSIREAMKVLSAFGIVEIRRGDGTYISKSDNKVIFEPLLFSLILSRTNIRELVELRELLEVEIVKLIIRNASDADLKDIRKKVVEMRRQIRSNDEGRIERIVESDLSFHRALGRATRNKFVEKIYYFVMDFFASTIKTSIEGQGKRFIAMRDHLRIYDALAERNIDEAVAAVKKSIIAWKTTALNTGDKK